MTMSPPFDGHLTKDLLGWLVEVKLSKTRKLSSPNRNMPKAIGYISYAFLLKESKDNSNSVTAVSFTCLSA